MQTLAERYWSKVKVGGRDDCWPWLAATQRKGYGIFRTSDGVVLAHRMAWRLTHGDAGRKHVLHTCDNPACCNPFHLFRGDNSDNVHDRHQKRRSRSALSPQERTEVRALARAGVHQRDIAAMYGISQATVSNLHRRKHHDYPEER